MKIEIPRTLTIENFGGPLVRDNVGDMNSGFARYDTSWGYDPFSKPGNLTWMEQPTSILTVSSTQGGTMNVMRQRIQGVDPMVYGVGRDGNLYQIQVTDSGNNNANLDQPSIIGALATGTNDTRSAAMVFYGTTEKIFYGDDAGLQKINFDGSGGASITTTTTSLLTNLPRPMEVFQGKVFFGNGNNIGYIDTTETIIDAQFLKPGLATGLYAVDLKATPDGNYLQIIAQRGNPNGGFDALVSEPGGLVESYKFLWNGTDPTITSFQTYKGIGLSTNQSFGVNNYDLAYDFAGAGILSNQTKVFSMPTSRTPYPTATFSMGNLLTFVAPEFEQSSGFMKASLYAYGKYDDEIQEGLFRLLRQTAVTPTKTDVILANSALLVSNNFYFPSYSSYKGKLAGVGKVYFSTRESSGGSALNDTLYVWKFAVAPTGMGSVLAGVYETQTQVFPKRISIKEVRLYTDPLVANNSFTVDLLGAGQSVLPGGSQIFTVGTNASVGDGLVLYNPPSAPTYAVGVRITNSSVLGTANWTGLKLELDYIDAGK